MSDHNHCLQVEADWLGRVLAFLEDHRGSDARVDRLVAEAPDAVRDTMVAIQWLNLDDPAQIAELKRRQQETRQ